MAEVAPDSSPAGNDTKLEQLLESTIEWLRNESSQLLAHWEELKGDGNMRMNASSLVIRRVDANYRFPSQFVLTITCDTPRDIALWKVCLATALPKLRYIPMLDSCSMALQQLFDSMLEYLNNETGVLESFREELKTDPSQRLEAHGFYLTGSRDEIQLHIYQTSPKHLTIWKACVKTALNKLDIQEKLMGSQYVCNFKVTMTSNEMKMVLDYLKPLTSKILIWTVALNNVRSAIMSNYLDFFIRLNAPKHINLYYQRKSKFWLNFIRKMGPSRVFYVCRSLEREMKTFLFPLADLVEDIYVERRKRRNEEPQPFPISAIKEILSRRCQYLSVNGSISEVSQKDVDDLIQFAHHLRKPISLILPTTFSPMSHRIGEYKVEAKQTPHTQHKTISIDHLHAKSLSDRR